MLLIKIGQIASHWWRDIAVTKIMKSTVHQNNLYTENNPNIVQIKLNKTPWYRMRDIDITEIVKKHNTVS